MEDFAQEMKLELKYCERCGGLWLRPGGSERVYCGGCAREVAEMATPKKRKGRARLPSDGVKLEAAIAGRGMEARA